MYSLVDLALLKGYNARVGGEMSKLAGLVGHSRIHSFRMEVRHGKMDIVSKFFKELGWEEELSNKTPKVSYVRPAGTSVYLRLDEQPPLAPYEAMTGVEIFVHIPSQAAQYIKGWFERRSIPAHVEAFEGRFLISVTDVFVGYLVLVGDFEEERMSDDSEETLAIKT